MDSFCRNDKDKIYTKHGVKIPQGLLMEINGKKALANYKGDKVVGYTTLDELIDESYSRCLPTCKLDF